MYYAWNDVIYTDVGFIILDNKTQWINIKSSRKATYVYIKSKYMVVETAKTRSKIKLNIQIWSRKLDMSRFYSFSKQWKWCKKTSHVMFHINEKKNHPNLLNRTLKTRIIWLFWRLSLSIKNELHSFLKPSISVKVWIS